MKISNGINKIVSSGLILLFVTVLVLPFARVAEAAVTNASDTLSRQGLSDGTPIVLSDHSIQLTTSLGVASLATIVITFPADFDGSTTGDSTGPLDFNDVDLWEDTTPDTTCEGDAVAETLVASAPSASQWSAAFSGTENRILTLTSGGASAIIAAASQICVEIGENAVGGAANSQYENPTTSGAKVITAVAGSEASQNITVNILTDDQVAVSATVAQSLTFAINGDNAIVFGALVTANARFAGDAAGTNGPTSASAHTMTIATNAPGGYNITYNGATLTSGANTIPVATITSDEDGVPGSAQFAIGFTRSGDATIATAYNQVSPTFNYSFVAGVATQIVSETVPTATETISAFYLANISGTIAAGSYSTTLTYTATANF